MSIPNHARGTRDDVRQGLDELVRHRVPAGVHVAALVLTIHAGGWRSLLLRAALWALRKAGHEVVTLEAPEPLPLLVMGTGVTVGDFKPCSRCQASVLSLQPDGTCGLRWCGIEVPLRSDKDNRNPMN